VLAPTRAELDLSERADVAAAVRAARPAAVLHMAGLASVAASWRDPARTLRSNVEMTLNLLLAVADEAPDAGVVLASSGEIYGAPESLPVGEGAPLSPQNPYAVSKAATDLLGGQYAASHGLRVVRLRPFNLAGPGQSDEYLVGGLARQVAEAELAGRDEVVLRVGNLDSRRDFTDVRDAARAYAAAPGLEPGPYNVCSGRAWGVRDVIEALARVVPIAVRYEQDRERMRAHDVPEIRGSAERLRATGGWEPEIAFEDMLTGAVDSWRERLG
jgi:GDP-4-dehydro-6-deoxy-D-mannose reductase